MSSGLVWLRRDLRLWDNHALSAATYANTKVKLVFVFDKNILDKLDEDDHRVEFLLNVLDSMKDKVNILYGDPIKLIPKFAKEEKIDTVYINRDYEQYAIKRDEKVRNALFDQSINFKSFKDQVIFEKDEVLNGKGDYYKVFTPYKNSYLDKLTKEDIRPKKVLEDKIINSKVREVKKLEDMNFKSGNIPIPKVSPIEKVKSFLQNDIDHYNDKRDFPALEKTSELSYYIRFGLVSIRSLFNRAMKENSKGRDIWISELVWRDFYSMILQAFPHVETETFNKKYKDFKWDEDEKLWQAWTQGKTGFPIVDAGMRQLNTEGSMHNRVRMIVASHLTKTLLLDYKKGEAYFAKKLFDYDLASNNGGWQWASSTGCDAAPYFRVFNPYRQSERFDKDGNYIKKYIPELKDVPKKVIHDPSKLTSEEKEKFNIGNYPDPIVDYSEKRKEIIERFKKHG